MNVVEPGCQYLYGPTELGTLSATALAGIGACGVVLFGAALLLLRGWASATSRL